MPLDARIEAEKLRTLYKEDPRQSSFNLLLIGEKGTGKTQILSTARKPVHIDSFDPGGTATLRKEIELGDIIPDVRWENEDPLDPRQYKLWEFEFDKRRKNGYFDQIGTYCLDSSTAWADCIMNYILKTIDKKGTHVGESPKWNRDYKPQRTLIETHIRQMLELPCDFILTGHVAPIFEPQIVTDPFTGEREKTDILVGYRYHTTGQGMVKIPLYFTELWVAQWKSAPKIEDQYYLLTAREGLYLASTRIGAGGKFEKHEKPNIKNMLKKAGWSAQDKPKLTQGESK